MKWLYCICLTKGGKPFSSLQGTYRVHGQPPGRSVWDNRTTQWAQDHRQRTWKKSLHSTGFPCMHFSVKTDCLSERVQEESYSSLCVSSYDKLDVCCFQLDDTVRKRCPLCAYTQLEFSSTFAFKHENKPESEKIMDCPLWVCSSQSFFLWCSFGQEFGLIPLTFVGQIIYDHHHHHL